jgi:hypothetical protein
MASILLVTVYASPMHWLIPYVPLMHYQRQLMTYDSVSYELIMKH